MSVSGTEIVFFSAQTKSLHVLPKYSKFNVITQRKENHGCKSQIKI